MVNFKDIIKQSKIIEEEIASSPDETKKEKDDKDRFSYTNNIPDNNALYKEACEYIYNFGLSIQSNKPYDIEPCFDIAEKIIKSLQTTVSLPVNESRSERTKSLLLMGFRSKGYPNYLVPHSVNVSIFAVKMGISMGYSKENLIKLAVSSLMHDIGMFEIPSNLIENESALSKKEFELIKSHSEKGARKIIQLSNGRLPWLANTILQVHEKENGEGYPHGLSGNEIDENAKIIGIVDTYEAITNERPYKKRKSPFTAIREIIRSRKGHFSPNLVKALLENLSVFPFGSYVQLNSKDIGKVITINEGVALRPVIKIIYNSEGRRYKDAKIVDLQKEPLLFITDVVSQEKLKHLNIEDE